MIDSIYKSLHFFENPVEIVKENWILAYFFDEKESKYYEIHYVKNLHYRNGLLIDDVWGSNFFKISAKNKIDLYVLEKGLEPINDFDLDEKLCFFLSTKKISKCFIELAKLSEIVRKQIVDKSNGLQSNFCFKPSLKPLITVVTTVYNNALLLEQTLQSVINQNCGEYEYIIKDANSTDCFEAILEKYKNEKIKVIRCKDKGIYDGMDQGIRAASGEYVEILNSDDLFNDSSVISNYVSAIKNKSSDAFCSDICIHFPNGKDMVRKADLSKLRYRSCVNHTSLVLKRKDYVNLGGFDLGLKIAADCDLTIKMVKAKLVVERLNFICVKFRAEGASNSLYTYKMLKENLICRKRFSKLNFLGYCYTILQYLKIKLLKR